MWRAYAAPAATCAALLACKPTAQERGAPEASASVGNAVENTVATAGGSAAATAAPARVHTVHATAAGESFDVERWQFALDRTSLTIVDAGMRSDLARILRDRNALLVTNGGFFGTAGEPLGLAMVGGRALSRFSPRLSGGVLVVDADRAALFEAESFDAGTSAQFAIQCKPRLVVGGASNVKRDDGQRAERTALCVHGEGRTLDVVVAKNPEGGPSLFALASYLATAGCDEALNLDGGPSTGVASREGDAVREERPRGPIRHAIVVSAR
jgi:uncharacterized protein YigE (DUF2233 family)